MVVQSQWEGWGEMDVDSAVNLNFLFAEVMGDPRRTTRFKTVGLMMPNVVNPLFVVPEYFSSSTPRNFLIPKGAYALGLEELKSAAAAPAVTSHEPGAIIPAGKTVNNMKGVYLVTLDNQLIFTQDKTNNVVRQNALKVVWRLAMPRIHLIAPDQTLESAQYMILLKEASTEEHPEGSLLESAVLLCNIQNLNFLSDKALFESFLQLRFDGLTKGKLSLALFNNAMKSLGTRATLQGKMIIAEAFSLFELALRAIFDECFIHVFDTIIENLKGVITLYRRVSDDFLAHTGEKTITSWGRVVGTQQRSLLFPNTDLRTAQGCVTLLKEMLEAALKKIAGVDAMALEKEYRDGEEVFVTAATSAYLTSASNVPNTVTLTTNTCTHWFAGGLKVIDKKGGIVKCTIPNGGKCTRNHVAPSRVTKAEAIRWNSTTSLHEFKTRIATQIETFQNFQV
jgi:hypothetical protein